MSGYHDTRFTPMPAGKSSGGLWSATISSA